MSEPRWGSLADDPLPTLLMAAYRERLNGILTIAAAGGSSEVYFRNGYPCGVLTPGVADQLGAILRDHQLLDAPTFDELLPDILASGRPMGSVLIERGLITEAQLADALRVQTRRRLFRLFFLERGDYTLAASVHGVGVVGAELVRVQPRRAIYHGVRNAWTAARVRTALRSTERMKVFATIDPATFQRYGFADEDAAVALALTQAPVTPEELAGALATPLEVVRAVVCAFLVTDALTLTEAAPGESPAAPPPTAAPPPAPAPRATTPSPPAPAPQPLPPPRAAAVSSNSAAASPLPGSRAAAASSPGVAANPLRAPHSPAPAGHSAKPAAAAASGSDPTTAVAPRSHSLSGLPTDAAALRQVVAARLAAAQSDDFYGMLGLSDGAGKDAIKGAYLAAAKQFHPDRWTGPEHHPHRQDVERIFRRLNEAYSTLYDDARREAWVKKRAEPKQSKADEAKTRAILEAERQFMQGEVLFKKHDLAGASAAFARAAELNPEDGETIAMVAWTRFTSGQATLPQIKPVLVTAVGRAPQCARAHYFLGVAYKEEELLDRAVNEFKEALKLDARLTEASTELRLTTMRREKAKQKEGDRPRNLLDRLRKR